MPWKWVAPRMSPQRPKQKRKKERTVVKKSISTLISPSLSTEGSWFTWSEMYSCSWVSLPPLFFWHLMQSTSALTNIQLLSSFRFLLSWIWLPDLPLASLQTASGWGHESNTFSASLLLSTAPATFCARWLLATRGSLFTPSFLAWPLAWFVPCFSKLSWTLWELPASQALLAWSPLRSAARYCWDHLLEVSVISSSASTELSLIFNLLQAKFVILYVFSLLPMHSFSTSNWTEKAGPRYVLHHFLFTLFHVVRQLKSRIFRVIFQSLMPSNT